jgi:preprotein translocase subunit SecF
MFVIKYKKTFVIISAILIALSIFSMIFFGLKFGIDFKGGSLLEVKYTETRPSQAEVEEIIKTLSLGSIVVQPMGEDGYSIKTRDINLEENVYTLEIGVIVSSTIASQILLSILDGLHKIRTSSLIRVIASVSFFFNTCFIYI